MFVKELPHPAWTHEKTYGTMAQRVVINREGKARNWDINRFGFYKDVQSAALGL
jgi:hypothetical protein